MEGGFDSKGLKVNLGKTKVIVSGRITKDGISKSEVDPCWVCSLRVKVSRGMLSVKYFISNKSSFVPLEFYEDHKAVAK